MSTFAALQSRIQSSLLVSLDQRDRIVLQPAYAESLLPARQPVFGYQASEAAVADAASHSVDRAISGGASDA